MVLPIYAEIQSDFCVCLFVHSRGLSVYSISSRLFVTRDCSRNRELGVQKHRRWKVLMIEGAPMMVHA